MKNRTRLFLVVAIGVLVIGLGTGLLASYGLTNIGLLGGGAPDDLTYVPSQAHMVAFANVHDLATSELRQKMRALEPNADARNQFEKETGVDVERDVDQVLVAAWPSDPNSTPQGQPLLLARGRFDTVRIEGVAREHGGQVEEYKGKRLIVIDSHPAKMAIGFLEPGLIAAGSAMAIHQAIDTKESSTLSVTSNGEVMNLISEAQGGTTWAVARFDSLTARSLPPQLAQQLPPINWFSATGYVDGGVRGTIRAEAKDDKSAQDLREVVRGFMALARLQAGDKAQFSELVNSLELGGQGKTVSLEFSIPANLIDTLAALSAQHRRPQEPNSNPAPDQPTRQVPSVPGA
jgi:hypothetical protein